MSNFQLQYLDTGDQHIDSDQFENVRDAIAKAERSTEWAKGFNIVGMEQKMSARHDERDANNKMMWRGILI